jgi:hypothetical protein
MSRSDYSHWNEEQDRVWWEEEGKHSVHVDLYDPELDDDYDTEARREDGECEDAEEAEADHSSSR